MTFLPSFKYANFSLHRRENFRSWRGRALPMNHRSLKLTHVKNLSRFLILQLRAFVIARQSTDGHAFTKVACIHRFHGTVTQQVNSFS